MIMVRYLFFAMLAFGVFNLLYGAFAYFGQRAVIHDFIQAAAQNDPAIIDRRVAWDDLRESLNDRLPETLSATSGLLGGRTLGPSPDQVPAIVDYYVRPENLEILFYFRTLFFADVPPEDFIHSSFWVSPYRFHITAGYPQGHEVTSETGISLPTNMMRVRMVFALRGMRWQMTEMHVPVFLIPRRTYDRPATAYFLPPDGRERGY